MKKLLYTNKKFIKDYNNFKKNAKNILSEKIYLKKKVYNILFCITLFFKISNTVRNKFELNIINFYIKVSKKKFLNSVAPKPIKVKIYVITRTKSGAWIIYHQRKLDYVPLL